MKYDICHGCIFFQPRLLTEEKVIPKSCKHPDLSELFGQSAKGFTSGTEVVYCKFFAMHPPSVGDYVVSINGQDAVSIVDTRSRSFKFNRVPQLYDNSKNIKRSYYEQIKQADSSECPY